MYLSSQMNMLLVFNSEETLCLIFALSARELRVKVSVLQISAYLSLPKKGDFIQSKYIS